MSHLFEMVEAFEIFLIDLSLLLVLQKLVENFIKLAFQLVSLRMVDSIFDRIVLWQRVIDTCLIGHVIEVLALVELHEKLLWLKDGLRFVTLTITFLSRNDVLPGEDVLSHGGRIGITLILI